MKPPILICPEDKKPCTCATNPRYEGTGCPREIHSDENLYVRMQKQKYTKNPFTNRTQSTTLGCALAMRVLQSELYHRLDDTERAECDELIRRWNKHLSETT